MESVRDCLKSAWPGLMIDSTKMKVVLYTGYLKYCVVLGYYGETKLTKFFFFFTKLKSIKINMSQIILYGFTFINQTHTTACRE